jgi:hypothetical protein
MEWQSTDLRVSKRDRDGKIYYGETTWKEHDQGARLPPTIRIKDREGGNGFQSLFDCLWSAGYRPAKDGTNEGLVASKDDHINDLRTVLFSQMGIKK